MLEIAGTGMTADLDRDSFDEHAGEYNDDKKPSIVTGP